MRTFRWPGNAGYCRYARCVPIAYRQSRWLRAGLAVVAGVLTGLAWQPYGFWWLLIVGLPAFTLLLRTATTGADLTDSESSVSIRTASRPRRRAFALGYLYGLGLLGITINWVYVLGIWVAVLLIAFEALFFGLLGLTLYLTSPLRWWPLAAALCWSLIEFLYSRVPFGGFGWVRLGYAVVDTPLAGFLPLIGVAGVSFLVALLTQLVAYAVTILPRRRAEFTKSNLRTGRALLPYGAGVVALLLLGVALPSVPLTIPSSSQSSQGSQTGRTMQVGIVHQGGLHHAVAGIGHHPRHVAAHALELFGLAAGDGIGRGSGARRAGAHGFAGGGHWRAL